MSEPDALFDLETHTFTVDDTETVIRPVKPSKASERRQWRQDALFELEELEEFYEGLPEVRL